MGDLAIAIAIDHRTLDSLAVLVVGLLIDPEGVGGIAHSVILQVLVGTDHDTRVRHGESVGAGTRQVVDAVSVVSEVVVDGPVPGWPSKTTSPPHPCY